MSEYTYKDVIIDPEDPRVEIGAKYYRSDYPKRVLYLANNDEDYIGTLEEIVTASPVTPFVVRTGDAYSLCACLIRKKEPEKKYVPFDLNNKEDKEFLRYKWIRYKRNEFEACIIAFKYHDTEWKAHVPQQGLRNGEQLLANYEFMDGSPVGKLVEE